MFINPSAVKLSPNQRSFFLLLCTGKESVVRYRILCGAPTNGWMDRFVCAEVGTVLLTIFEVIRTSTNILELKLGR